MAAASTRGGGTDAPSRQQGVLDWLNHNSQAHGSYVGSNSSGSSSSSALSFNADGSSNGSALVPGATNALLVAAVSRWPPAYSAYQLQISVLVLFVSVAVATVVQVVLLGVWKLLRLNPGNFPK